MSITVGTNSWCTLAEANTYFTTRLGCAAYWNTAASKEAALVTAFKQIIGSGLFDISASATEQEIKDAQCEMALFLLIHQADMDARAGLQAQGVIKAGIVQEEYDPAAAGKPMIPANVMALLSAYTSVNPLFSAEITRDDDA